MTSMNGKNTTVGFKDQMVLRPDKASVSDLLSLLTSSNIRTNNCVDFGVKRVGVRLAGFTHRFIILVSVLLQMLLLSLRRPVAWVGTILEDLMNLFASENYSLFAVVSKFLQGKLAFPDAQSKSYRSMIGLADTRETLDKNITPDHGHYIASLTVMAAKLAYENPKHIENTVKNSWNMEFLECFNCTNDYHGQLAQTQAFIFSDKSINPELIVIAFRGTQPFDTIQWCIDVDYSWYEHHEAGRIHRGFMRALGIQSDNKWPKELHQEDQTKQFAYYALREKLRALLKANPNAKFIVTGHSLGGALAVLFPVVLMFHEEDEILQQLDGVYTYGQPRVGDEKLEEYVAGRLRRYQRVVYSNDMVPRLPFDDPAFQYKHFGTCCYFNSLYHGQVMKEQPNNNYFSLLGVVPKYMNAAWELGRSFVIGYVKGKDYKEGWILTGMRCFGLVVPGLPAHTPQDYVNSTRLAASHPPIFAS